MLGFTDVDQVLITNTQPIKNGAHQWVAWARNKPTWTSFDPVSVPPAAAVCASLVTPAVPVAPGMGYKNPGKKDLAFCMDVLLTNGTIHRLCLIQTHLLPIQTHLTPWVP